jgi:hypothetical protein
MIQMPSYRTFSQRKYMHRIIRYGNIILLALLLQQCTYSQQPKQLKPNNMDTTKKENNPV